MVLKHPVRNRIARLVFGYKSILENNLRWLFLEEEFNCDGSVKRAGERGTSGFDGIGRNIRARRCLRAYEYDNRAHHGPESGKSV